MVSDTMHEVSVRLAVRTPDVLASLRQIAGELDGFTLQDDPQATRVDILVLEIGDEPAAELETIRILLREGAVGTLFVTSARATSEILLPALRTGAKEFFQQPIDPKEVRNAFLQVPAPGGTSGAASRPAAPMGKIYSVIGAKGGVGATTFAVNLATSLQALDPDKQVALIDLNRLIGEVPLFLDLETDFNWEEIGKNINRLDAAYLTSALVRHGSGVYVLPAPVLIESETHLPPDFLLQILRVMRESFAAIVIDMGMYLDQESVKILEKSERIFLLATLNLPCMINVKRIRDSLRSSGRIDESKVRIIANRFEKKSQIGVTEANRIIGSEIFSTIPNDYNLTMTAINSGKILAEVDKNSSVAKAYRDLAAVLAEKAEPKKSRWRLFG
jgi:pilus assembly protein CpaE